MKLFGNEDDIFSTNTSNIQVYVDGWKRITSSNESKIQFYTNGKIGSIIVSSQQTINKESTVDIGTIPNNCAEQIFVFGSNQQGSGIFYRISSHNKIQLLNASSVNKTNDAWIIGGGLFRLQTPLY